MLVAERPGWSLGAPRFVLGLHDHSGGQGIRLTASIADGGLLPSVPSQSVAGQEHTGYDDAGEARVGRRTSSQGSLVAITFPAVALWVTVVGPAGIPSLLAGVQSGIRFLVGSRDTKRVLHIFGICSTKTALELNRVRVVESRVAVNVIAVLAVEDVLDADAAKPRNMVGFVPPQVMGLPFVEQPWLS